MRLNVLRKSRLPVTRSGLNPIHWFAVFFLIAAPAQALIGGKKATGASDVVRLVFTNGWVCTGVFIDENTILTAAHCLTHDHGGPELQLSLVQTSDDQPVDVVQTSLYRHPKFQSQGWPAYDVGILKTSKYSNFAHQFIISAQGLPILGAADIYGCGRVGLSPASRERRVGQLQYLKMGSVLFFIGSRAWSSSVSVAPNDSGGPIVDLNTQEILAVATTTTATLTYFRAHSWAESLPILSTGTAIASPETREFILAHMGSPKN